MVEIGIEFAFIAPPFCVASLRFPVCCSLARDERAWIEWKFGFSPANDVIFADSCRFVVWGAILNRAARGECKMNRALGYNTVVKNSGEPEGQWRYKNWRFGYFRVVSVP